MSLETAARWDDKQGNCGSVYMGPVYHWVRPDPSHVQSALQPSCRYMHVSQLPMLLPGSTRWAPTPAPRRTAHPPVTSAAQVHMCVAAAEYVPVTGGQLSKRVSNGTANVAVLVSSVHHACSISMR
jgi:hypothetical protein